MEDFISKSVHEEVIKRLDEENDRQNHRISALENTVAQIANIMSSVERLATNMEHMAREQQDQGERLKTLESQDGEMWRKIVSYTITAIISIILGFLASKIGL